ncbi:hypothetical protein N7481_007251 [Penicillium waksmanii]|uniref:uncharacterized protein n=1 Tax=Penicillium waksmanii TaxID=69791 RepID=UPI0025489466|nr:uncharacterized protein N7481_007251 [Penicillium waksmanii]KAJ5979953.1 hypothetical protein N7481_007251 [Penicillium waksmanii]
MLTARTVIMVPYLPLEIMEMIFSSLASPEDGIGFALASKYTYDCFLSFLEQRKIDKKLSKLLPIEETLHRQPFGAVDERGHLPRIRLLPCLQTDRLRASGTQDLQSTDQFQNRGSLPHSRHPMVNVCPCIRITFDEAIHLHRGLSKNAGSWNSFVRPLPPNSPAVPLYTHGSVFFESEHQCSYVSSPDPDMPIQTKFTLVDGKLHLVNVILLDRDAYNYLIPRALYPLYAKECLRQIFSQMGLGFWGQRYDDCGFSGYEVQLDGRFFLQILIIRDLGDDAWPNMDWERNCHERVSCD